MKHEKRNTNPNSSSYPQYCFRIPASRQEQFDQCLELIDALYDKYRAKQKPDELTIKKNDIIIEALEKGLKLLKKGK